MTAETDITWTEFDQPVTARWRSEAGVPAPRRVQVADESLALADAYKLVCEGTALLWRGDYHHAKQLLQALSRRMDGKSRAPAKPGPRGKPGGQPAERSSRPSRPSPADLAQVFHQQRQLQGQRARILGMLLLPFEADHFVPLRRAPDVQQACLEAYGPASEPYVASLRELLGLIGAHEWRKAGVEIAALQARIHAHYGVFAPVRGEYLGLVWRAPLPELLQTTSLAFDIGTGTGVLAAMLARRGVASVVATDQDPRALTCARENLERLGVHEQVSVVQADLFPPAEVGRAALIVCNPPWVPARPNSPLDHAVYDPDSRMLRGFLGGLATRLLPGGEGWLVLSDLAEHLGLRTREDLLAWIAAAGLKVLGRLDKRPAHPRVGDVSDPLHSARAAELTSLWRLGHADTDADAVDALTAPAR